MKVVQLFPGDPDPPLAAGSAVPSIPSLERNAHAPDRHLMLLDEPPATLLARCSIWWSHVPQLPGERVGVIGHYAARHAAHAAELLCQACGALAAAGCTMAIGPMDGNTWRRYRFIVERGTEPSFFLEPDNPDDWPKHWSAAEFTPIAAYTSRVNDRLERDDPRIDRAAERLAGAGVSIRSFDTGSCEADLRRIHSLSLVSFRQNFLYTPIDEEEFLSQNRAILPFVRPELVLMAERHGELAGFIFAVPDVLRARGGAPPDAVIIKTVAVAPGPAHAGLGSVLVALVQRAAREMGFRRAIHALMHERNVSQNISRRFAVPIRRYALFARPLDARDRRLPRQEPRA